MHVDLKNEVISDLLKNAEWASQGLKVKLDESESVEAEVEEEEVNEEVEVHSCPLCETELAEPLSEETLQEHVNYILSVLNESEESSEDMIDEDTEEDDAE